MGNYGSANRLIGRGEEGCEFYPPWRAGVGKHGSTNRLIGGGEGGASDFTNGHEGSLCIFQ
jgi:hypothetical protein